MKTKKKLIAIGVAASILTALFVLDPGGRIGSLASRMLDQIPNPTVDHQIIPRLPNNVFGRTNGDEYYHPRGVAVYGDKLFVTDWYRHQVKVVNKSTGEVIRIIGKHGGENGEFSYPFNIVIDEKNKFFYVTDLNNHRVQKFNLETYAYVAKIGTQGSGPGDFVNPTGIALDVENNRLYVSDYHCRVQRFELSTLQYRDTFGGTCGNNNNQFNRHNGYGPESLEVDSEGNVYVADTWNNRVQKFTHNGQYLATVVSSATTNTTVTWPMGLFIDKGGYLYVTSAYTHRIKKLDIKAANNPLIREYGSYGNDSDEFHYPRGIFVDQETDIYVADTNSHRIKIFQQHIIVPTAPTSLTATPNVTEIGLTWTAASPRTGTPLLDYIVEYKKTTADDWRRLSDGIGTNTSATIAGLDANTDYQFRVFARNTAREDGEKSASIQRKTLNTLAPKAPTNLVAGIGNRQINLSWTASNTNGGSAIKDYIVEFRLSGGQWQVFPDGVRSTTTADVTGLANDTRYDFRVKAENSTGTGAFSPYSAIVSRAPTADDKCNDIAGVQTVVPKNLKRNSQGDCVCINEGVRMSVADPATCTLTCSDTRREPAKPQFKVVYDDGYPRLYENNQDTVGTPMTARRIIISDDADGTVLDTNSWIPLFRPNVQPFYDGPIIQDALRLSLARNGNTLKMLWYGNRVDDRIERVKGRIIIDGSPDIRWTGFVEQNTLEDNTDKIRIADNNPKVIYFDMVVNPAIDSFIAKFDLGSREDACVEKPLIIFDKNASDATGSMNDQLLPINTATALTANAFSRPGYQFAGWNTAADGEGTNYANRANYTMESARNITLYAKWAASTYPITYNANGATSGSVPAAQTKIHDVALILGANSSALVKTGYTFSGWNTAADGTGTNHAAGANYTANAALNLYAKWTLNTHTVSAAANIQNGSITPATRSVGHNATTTFTVTPNPGYAIASVTGCGGTLSGSTYTTGQITGACTVSAVFSLNAAASCTGTRPANSIIKMDNGASTVSHPWTHSVSTGPYILCTFQCNAGTTYNSFTNTCDAVAVTYPVTYNANGATGGSVLISQIKTHNVNLTLAGNLGNLVKTGYTFAGWNTAADGNGINYNVGGIYTANAAVILYAKWIANSYNIFFSGQSAEINANPISKTVVFPATTVGTLPSNPIRTGYTFGGWYTGVLGTGTQFTATTTISANLTVYAKWTPVAATYAVTYNSNGATSGSVPAAQTKTHNIALTLANNTGNLAKTGYIFTGWNTTTDGTGANYTAGENYTANAQVILYAKWTAAPINGSCGTASTAYPSDATGYGSSTLCATGTSNPANPVFPVVGTPTTWTCTGANGGTNSGTCTATKTAATTYEVTYNANGATGGTIPTAQTKTHDITLVLASNSGNLVKTGYTFAGWNTATDGTGTNYAAGANYIANAQVILYAKWTVAADITAPTVTLDLPATYTALTVPVTITPSEENVSYFFTEGPTPANGISVQPPTTPRADASGWVTTKPTTYTFPEAGSRTLFVWVKDTAGNVSTSPAQDVVVITLPEPTAPTVVQVTSTKPNGAYKSGTTIPITIKFSRPVIVTGIPTLILETGTNNVTIPFKQKEADGETLTFEYIVSDGNISPDLNYVATDSLKLDTAAITIKDSVSGVAVNRTLPALTSAESLAGSKDIVIDTTKPAAPVAIIVPQQVNITLSSAGTGSYIATGSTMTINVACAAGEKVKIYNHLSLLPIQGANCSNNLVTLSIDLFAQAGPYNYYATITDMADNESDRSPRIMVLKGQTESSAPSTPDLESIFDLGISSTDNLTSETQPRFTLTCVSGSTVNLYDSTTLIGTAPCMADTAQILPLQPFSSGVHSLTAKQSINGTTSATSGALSLTIDTAPLTVVIARAAEQSEPATSSTIKFTATFNRAIDANSFICSDVTVVNGSCTNIALLGNNAYMVTVTATAQGIVKAILYPGRVQTNAGNTNTEATGVNTVTYGTPAATAECSALRSHTVPRPKSSSLGGLTLCKAGTPSAVSYSSSRLQWTYQCRSAVDGTTASCTVAAVLDSAPSCDLKPVNALPFDECSIENTSNMFNFHTYLSCLGVVPEKKSCTDAGCTQNAKRQELISIGVRLRGIPLESGYECQKSHTDTVKGVASWVCEAAEKAQTAGLISATNKQFRPLDTMTRSEAYSVLMKSICVHPETTYKNWQTEVAKAAKEYGFTTRSVATFEPNRQILRQELFVLAARLAEYAADNPGLCEPLPEELICES